MDRICLQEAFRAMELLEEEAFGIDDAGIKVIIDFHDHDELNDIVDVVDPEAEEDEDVKDSYIGDVILECTVCHSPIFKAVEDVVVDDEEELANLDDECPICHSTDGFKVIGTVAPFEEEAELKVEVEDKPDEDSEDEDDDIDDIDDDVDESLKEALDESCAKNEGILGAGAGAVAGGLLGGPLGAVAGGLAGNALGNALKKEELEEDEECENCGEETVDEGLLGSIGGNVAGGVAGKAAGAAIGGAIGGPAGAAVGSKVGSVAGKIGGSLLGGSIGQKQESVEGECETNSKEPVEEGVLGAIGGGIAGAALGHPVMGAIAGSAIQNNIKNKKQESIEDCKEDENCEEDSVDEGLFGAGIGGALGNAAGSGIGRAIGGAIGGPAGAAVGGKIGHLAGTVGGAVLGNKVQNQNKEAKANDKQQLNASLDESEDFPGLDEYESKKAERDANDKDPKFQKSLKDAKSGKPSKVAPKMMPEECEKKISEGFERVDLEMEDKIIHVSEEEKEPIPDAEMITPVSQDLENEIMSPVTDDEEDVNLEAPELDVPEEPAVEEEPMEDEIPEDENPEEEEEPEFEESLESNNGEALNEGWEIWSNLDGKIATRPTKELALKDIRSWTWTEDSQDPERKGKVKYSIKQVGNGDEEEVDFSGAYDKEDGEQLDDYDEVENEPSDEDIDAYIDDKLSKKEEDLGENSIDYQMNDFEEDKFNSLGEAYLKNVYENVNTFNTSNVTLSNDDKLIVEGIIKFNSGKEKATKFIFEAKDADRNGKVRMIGENTQITRGKKAFTLSGQIDNAGKFIAESLNYNYRADSNRVYGTVKIND